MLIALFALSLVMIVGGIAAVVQGFPYVRLESGLAMVIGGTTAASAGVVLVGLAAVVLQLLRLERRLERLGDASGLQEGMPPLDTAFRGATYEEVPPVPTVPRPSLAGAAGLAGITLGAAAAGLSDIGGATGKSGTEPSSEHEPLLPDLLPPAEPAPEPASIGPDEDLFAPPEDRPGHVANPGAGQPASDAAGPPDKADPAQEELALRPSLDELAADPPAKPEPPAEEAPAPAAVDAESPKEERQVVGSYASGGNTYVMYSDGTIDADTPRGRFSFQSLDELKDFIASGEATERGAA